MNEIIGLVVFVLFGAAYFAPTIVAGLRQHHQLGAIAVINFFLGWTLIGWVVAMAMAASHTKPAPTTWTMADHLQFVDDISRARQPGVWPPPTPHGEQERSA